MIVKNATFGSIQNNCYLVVDEKTNCSALVDCTECSQKMLDFIGDTDLKYIFLTHGHFDHITGVKGNFARGRAYAFVCKTVACGILRRRAKYC